MIEGQSLPHSTGFDLDPARILGVTAGDEFEVIGRQQREIQMSRGSAPGIARRVAPTVQLF